MDPKQDTNRMIKFLVAVMTVAFVTSPTGAMLPPAIKAQKLVSAAGMVRLAEIAPPADPVLSDLQGRRVRLSDYKGKVVLLNFWTTWCPACIEETAALEKLYRKYASDGFALVTVNWKESPQKIGRFMERNNLSFPVLTDGKGEMSRHFKVRSLPTTYLLNKEGYLIGLAIGPREWNGRAFNTLVAHLIEMP